MKQPCGYTNISDAIVIESMGALFILNRLMMKELNEVAYQTIDRSRLFKLYLFVQQKKPLNQRLFLFGHEKRRPPFMDGRLC